MEYHSSFHNNKRSERRWDQNGIFIDTSDAEYWDQENCYLSEHNYEETLDIETAKSLLNFGDDYRNFLESNNSEVQSPRVFDLQKKKKTSARVGVSVSNDSESEDEKDDLFLVIGDLIKDFETNDAIYTKSRIMGFENQDVETKEKLLLKCEASLKFLKTLQSATDQDRNSDIVQRKQDREIRCKSIKFSYILYLRPYIIYHSVTLVLQNKWRHLEKTLKKDEKIKSMYDDLKDNIHNIDYELKDIKRSIKETDSKKNLSIKKVNRFLKDLKIKLSRMKPKLFELNLTVHSLIGEVCEDDVELRHLEADRVKEDLVEVYEFWDEVSLMVSERLAQLEETESKLRTVEAGLEEVTKFLTQETGDLLERMTTTDSGISDGSDMRLDQKIKEQEDIIMKMKESGGGKYGVFRRPRISAWH